MNRYELSAYGWIALLTLMAFLMIPVNLARAQTWQPYTEPGNNVTSLYQAFTYINTTTSGMFGLLLSLSIFVVVFILIRSREEFSDALLVSSFISFVLTIFLKILNLAGDWLVILFSFSIVISIVLSAKNWIRG